MSPRVAASTLLALLFLAGAAGAAPDFGSVQVQPYDPPKAAPAFSLPDLGGKTFTLAEHRGKVLMLFFWATW
jgi:cytochrome oxidase Cu insertion factor (SCO1/SenC/PrrC family)